MLGALARRLFGSANDRYLKSLGPIVSAINELEPQLEAMSDDELRARTARFKQQLVIGHCFELGLQFVDRGYDRTQALQVAVIGGAEQPPG